jgi:hypothetical protein
VGNRCADHVTPLYPQKLALTSPTGGGHSVGIVRSRTKATEFSFSLDITRLASNEIFLPSNKIHREIGRAKDLSKPLHNDATLKHGPDSISNQNVM